MTTASQGDRTRPGPRAPSRFGPTAVIREASPSEDAHLLSLFAERAEAPDDDRRRSTRFRAVEQRAWLGWWGGPAPGSFVTRAARLDDISQGGARLVMSDPPPVGELVWVCLGLPGPAECVQAKVLASVPTDDASSTVRLAFGAPCPLGFYRLAIYGLSRRRPDGA